MHALRAIVLALVLAALVVWPLAAVFAADVPPVAGSLAAVIWAVASSIVTIASAVVALTGTPDPATPWGKVYRVIELLALVVLRAKETGLAPGASGAAPVRSDGA